jgi:hypothetical protein
VFYNLSVMPNGQQVPYFFVNRKLRFFRDLPNEEKELFRKYFFEREKVHNAHWESQRSGLLKWIAGVLTLFLALAVIFWFSAISLTNVTRVRVLTESSLLLGIALVFRLLLELPRAFDKLFNRRGKDEF